MAASPASSSSAVARISRARRALVIGIGGGGDVVGSLAFALAARALGTPSTIGGLTWERRPVDPLPGPRHIEELLDPVQILHPAVALADGRTRGPRGVPFAESRMADVLKEPTVLVDPNPSPATVGDGLADAAAALGCDLVVLLDVGGDVLAHGDEPGLASPLADALLLAAAPRLVARGVDTIGVVFGAGCDGELTPEEVIARHEELAAAGGALGDVPLPVSALEEVEAAIATVVTEASAMAVRCARGERGTTAIRAGRRSVELTAEGGRLRAFDPLVALASAARLGAVVQDATGLRDGHDRLTALGIRTELAYELDAAAANG